MVDAVRASRRVLIPMPEVAATAHSESQRNVLAMTLDPTLDRDGNGFADADNDRDGRIDEDFERGRDQRPEAGIVGIDDDGDGAVDEGDDQRRRRGRHGDDEDKFDGVDND